MIGDIVFFKKTDSLISKAIANITGSNFTHVGLIVSYDKTTEVITIIESDRFIKTKLTKMRLEERHIVYSIGEKPKDMTDRILKFAYTQIGTEYDYIQILGLFLSLISKGDRFAIFNSTNKLICSELIDLTYYKSGIKRLNTKNIGNVTPQELLSVYELKEVKKGV